MREPSPAAKPPQKASSGFETIEAKDNGHPSPFTIEARDAATGARAGRLVTAHGEVETPVFMPVATQASVKAMDQQDLAELGVQAILANAYHLYLRPGTATMAKAGGLHRFMNYPGTILTDSGGFQVMSLSQFCRMQDDGVTFKSHLDGSMHTFTPADVIRIQQSLGSDIWTSLDECLPYPCEETSAVRALERTMRWTEASRKTYREISAGMEKRPLFFPIVQGALFPHLRRQAAEHMAGIDPDGVSIGGLSVGEPKDLTWSVLSATIGFLPPAKPRYLMGVGTPQDLWKAVETGVDMMDCVWPTRVARHGQAMIHAGKLNLANSACREDFGPLDPDCSCRVCRAYSRAYLSHLYRAKEISVHALVSYHNLHFLMEIMHAIRKAVVHGHFAQSKAQFFARYHASAI